MALDGLHRTVFGAGEPMGERVRAEQAEIGGVEVWRFAFEPGWHYTKHVEPTMCSAPHVGYIERGTLHVVMDDGTEADVGPGSALVIAPGHDAWTVGDEECVLIDFGPGFA